MGSRAGIKNGSIKGDELLKYPSVQRWLDSLNQSATSIGKKGLTLGAKRQRLGRLREYVKELNPDELLMEAQQDIDKAGQRLNDYFQARINSSVGWNTACTNLSFLRGFYTHNGLVFPKKWRIPKRKVSRVSKRDAKVTIYDYDEENGEPVFKNGTLQHFVQNLNFRDQTIALCLLSTGADATDLLKLNVGFVKDAKGKMSDKRRFLWHDNREKDGVEFKTFFSEEATAFLKRYVEQERAGAKDDEPLFVASAREYEIKGEKVVVDERLTAHALSVNFRESAKKMGYTERGESSPFRPKRFRHLFRTACGNANVDVGYTMTMMGHAGTVSSGYLEKSDGLFLQEYIKVEPYVTVFGVSKGQVTEMSETIAGLKDEVQVLVKSGKVVTDKTATLEEQVNSLTSQVDDLKGQLKSATDLLHSFEPLLDTFNEIAGTPQGQELIKQVHEDKTVREVKEAEEGFDELKGEVTNANPIPKRKSE